MPGFLVIYLLAQLSEINVFKRPTHRIAPIFGLLGWLTNLVSGLAFGKPYTAFFISGLGWGASVFFVLPFPGCGNGVSCSAWCWYHWVLGFSTSGMDCDMVARLDKEWSELKFFYVYVFLFFSFLLCCSVFLFSSYSLI